MPSRSIERSTTLLREHEVPGAWHCIRGQAVESNEVAPASIVVPCRLRIASPVADGLVGAACWGRRCVKKTTLAAACCTRAVVLLPLPFSHYLFCRIPGRRNCTPQDQQCKRQRAWRSFAGASTSRCLKTMRGGGMLLRVFVGGGEGGTHLVPVLPRAIDTGLVSIDAPPRRSDSRRRTNGRRTAAADDELWLNEGSKATLSEKRQKRNSTSVPSRSRTWPGPTVQNIKTCL